MRVSWMLAVASVATLSMAVPTAGFAQDRSQSARGRQEQSAKERERERQEAYEQSARARREAELERARRAEEERLRQRRGTQGRITSEEARRREAERERMRQRRDDDYGRYDDYDYGRNSNKQGPAFCRSGAGHPVHGREWCRQKGYSLGGGRWETARWDDIRFRDMYQRRNQQLSRSALLSLLGSATLGRFESYGRQYGSGTTTGYWLPESSAHILQLSVGNVPIARLVDRNRDGRVDNVLLWR